MKNKIIRLWLKFLFFGYNCFCFIFRPRVRGAYVLVACEKKILLIKNSYKDGWTFPCGMVDRNETEIQGAKRELFEEVGINCELSDLVFLEKYISNKGFKEDHQHFHLLKLKLFPVVKLDMTEVVEYRWVSIYDFQSMDVPDSVKFIVGKYKDFIFEL